jgi:hypothetical protein
MIDCDRLINAVARKTGSWQLAMTTECLSDAEVFAYDLHKTGFSAKIEYFAGNMFNVFSFKKGN